MNAITGHIESSAWRRLRETLGGIVWSSFQAALIATTLLFVLVDPIALAQATHQSWLQNRIPSYGAGLLVFWAATTLSAALLSGLSNTSVDLGDG